MSLNSVKQYQSVGAHANVMDADAHRLIELLLIGALDKIALSKGYMQKKMIKEKGEHISMAISIIDGLQSSLDLEKGQDIASNLYRLYEYMMMKLVEANMNNEVSILDEVTKLLLEIKAGWDGIKGK